MKRVEEAIINFEMNFNNDPSIKVVSAKVLKFHDTYHDDEIGDIFVADIELELIDENGENYIDTIDLRH
jgi:hypothetical protein